MRGLSSPMRTQTRAGVYQGLSDRGAGAWGAQDRFAGDCRDRLPCKGPDGTPGCAGLNAGVSRTGKTSRYGQGKDVFEPQAADSKLALPLSDLSRVSMMS